MGGGDPCSGAQFLAVANTHVLFNPKRGDIKLAQLRLLIRHLQALISAAVPQGHVGHVPALVMGDFNSVPDSPLYRFVRDGLVNCLEHHRKDIAGVQVVDCLFVGGGTWLRGGQTCVCWLGVVLVVLVVLVLVVMWWVYAGQIQV